MWSLCKKDVNSDSILDQGECLEPLKFSNNKTQADIVQEVLTEINNGNKLIFIHGVCGTGKSAIALNLARHFKKTSIVVPIKSLQEQYETDYTQKKFILKKDKSPLKIAVIKGRNNFRCPFNGEKADDPELPCTIELKEKHTPQLLQYISQNPDVKNEEFSTASDIKRMNIAPVCPYWAPIMPAEINPKGLSEVKKIKYETISGKQYALFQRKKGCPCTDQYEAYANADVLIFNSMKYQIETQIGRKPKTDLDIIDECDEFLDSFSSERKINIKRLDKSPILQILETALQNPNLAEDEELNYYNTIVEIARSFENLLDESYISIEQQEDYQSQSGLFGQTSRNKENPIIITIVSINLAQKLSELIEQNNVLVMMSGTLHSEQVLKEIFGLKDFKIIQAESKNPGTVHIKKTGTELNCSFSNFKNNTITRSRYLKILDMQLSRATPPTLVHVSAFSDLPSEEENSKLMLDNIITQERLREIQKKGNSAIDEFAAKQEDILFTTKCSRGIDFAGDKCNSIIITKFPYPNIQSLFWKILKQEQPDKFMQFYLDKARRELIQKVSRGVRFK